MIPKIIKLLTSIALVLAIAFGVLMIFKAKRSRSMTPNIGIENNQLKACSHKPNCISSFSEPGAPHYYPPIEADNNIKVTWDNLNMVLTELKLTIIKSETSYIHATDKTPLMGFVDDIEFLLDESAGKIFIRSASRVGYSDMGKNKKRMDTIVKNLIK